MNITIYSALCSVRLDGFVYSLHQLFRLHDSSPLLSTRSASSTTEWRISTTLAFLSRVDWKEMMKAQFCSLSRQKDWMASFFIDPKFQYTHLSLSRPWCSYFEWRFYVLHFSHFFRGRDIRRFFPVTVFSVDFSFLSFWSYLSNCILFKYNCLIGPYSSVTSASFSLMTSKKLVSSNHVICQTTRTALAGTGRQPAKQLPSGV